MKTHFVWYATAMLLGSLYATEAAAVEALSTEELISHCAIYGDDPDGEDGIFCVRYIQGFIDDVAVGIKVIPETAESQKEKALLMKVMEHIRDVKMIRDRTFDEIEPMK